MVSEHHISFDIRTAMMTVIMVTTMYRMRLTVVIKIMMTAVTVTAVITIII